VAVQLLAVGRGGVRLGGGCTWVAATACARSERTASCAGAILSGLIEAPWLATSGHGASITQRLGSQTRPACGAKGAHAGLVSGWLCASGTVTRSQ
jgi:hypothetical protein